MSALLDASTAVLLARTKPLRDVILAAGGMPLIVGGAVRDAMCGKLSSDIDIEVYQIDAEALATALRSLGKVNQVGRAFGVLKLHTRDGNAYDLSIPRRDNRNPSGARGAIPPLDRAMTPRDAAARRDFTWNAMALTPTGQLLDFFDGMGDLRTGTVRHVSDAFSDDPLRVLRAMRFAARFDMQLAPETAQLCQTLLPRAAEIAVERAWGEWAKWALAPYPRAGLHALAESGWLALYPELEALRGCQQQPDYHPEGDVWAHTGYVCAAATRIASHNDLDDHERRVLLFAALCHDLGKPQTTVLANGRLRSHGHAQAGGQPTRALLKRMGAPQTLISTVLPLVHEHMGHYGTQPTPRTIRRLAARLAPATIAQWAQLVEADHSGRPPLAAHNPAEPFSTLARVIDVIDGPPAPILSGRDLIDAGYAPGPALGGTLRQAYTAQIDGAFETADEGLHWLALHNSAPDRTDTPSN